MERKDDPPPPSAPSIPPAAGEANHTSSSSSSSTSPPDFLRHIHAVFKRHRPLGTLQSNASRASRVLVSQAEPSQSAAGNNTSKRPSVAGASIRVARLSLNSRTDGVAEAGANPPEDSSLTPPSITGTMSPFEMGCDDPGPVACSDPLAHLPLDGNAAGLTFQKGDGHLESWAVIADNNLNQGHLWSMEISNAGSKFGGGARFLERRDELHREQHFMDPVTRSSAASATCATTMSVYSGPTVQCTRAPSGQTAFGTQISSSAAEAAVRVQDHGFCARQKTAPMEDHGLQDHQPAPHTGKNVKEKGVPEKASCLQSQDPSKENTGSNVGSEHSQYSKVEKATQKKYNPDVFFKVNRKLYQKLGKMGSGGSSEVHKVISSDCIIYALKKIKLKGRDYPTAYGFCQEIEYLNMLKGKSNIIQLIDYEVTDKALLKGVVTGSMSTKDGKIRDDQYIYMVLEYGEIDLAHMLSHKWKEMNSSSWSIDEHWLRFYWQQMLEAVNTIHEERIVHSDLKPANFLLVRGSLKLIDFGIAKAIMSDTTNIQRDAQVGTLNYMSPEAFLWNEQDANGNTIKCGRPSDIWSLGCILYQMVYGKTPFAEYKTFWAKFKVITDKNHEIKYETVSNPWLIDLMRRCLAWDHNKRWRIPQLLQHPFLVPPMMPRELPPVQGHPYKLLMEKVGDYWDDPEVSRLCSELHGIITNLEISKRDSALHA